MERQPQSRRWFAGIGTGKSSALRQAVAEAIEAGKRPVAWLPTVSDVGLRTERVEFPDPSVAVRLGADTFAGRLARNLSSGERQRVRLALALSSTNGFAAFDEPCRHLDPEHVEALNRLLHERTAAGMNLAVCDVRRQLADGLFDQDLGGREDELPVVAPCPPPQGDCLSLEVPNPFLPSSGKAESRQRIGLERGSLVVLRGPNGSGKTSLLEALARSAREAGAVFGYSRQEPEHQVFASTPRDEISGLSRRHSPARWALDDFVRNLRIEPWMSTPTPRLPLGVLCVLGAWIALRMGHDLVLLDEPTQGLDVRTARALAGELVRCARQGARIVAASHDPELAGVANRAWSVRAGVLTLEGDA
jgi:ABC-type multidrug transport system ATPase subunit